MKILASDFDDTIYFEDDIEKTKNNIISIKKFISAGNLFLIITGRNYSDLKLLLNEYSIPYSYLVCCDGAKIFNSVDYCLDTNQLDYKEVEFISNYLKENNYNYYLDDGYNETNNPKDCVKVTVNLKDEKAQIELINQLKKTMKLHVYASRYHINIINQTVNKANALKKLFNIENLDYEKLRVIGDNDNDYEMLKDNIGAVIKKHHPKLDSLNKKEFDTLSDYIKELM